MQDTPVIDLSRLQQLESERDELRERVKQLQDENALMRDAIDKLISELARTADRPGG